MLWQPGEARRIARTGELCNVSGDAFRERRDGAERSNSTPETIGERLFATRRLTLDLAAPLSDADATIQPFPDASPAKWHLAHTTWFFETFILRDHVPGYRPFDERWAFLFNTYYEAEGPRHARPGAACSAARRWTRFARIARTSTRRSSGAAFASSCRARPDRTRHQSRAAASGTVPDRHPRDVGREPVGAGLWRSCR